MESVFVTVRCKIFSGAFSGERIFQVSTVEGGLFVGIAPFEFCSKLDGGRLARTEPSQNHPLDGTVNARVVRNGGNTARVAFPDGDDAEVSVELLKEREAGIAHVSI